MKSLFSPVVVGGRTLPSRVLLAPINTGFVRLGRPTLQLLRFHEERSGPEIGISMLGNVAVCASASTNGNTAVLQSGSRIDRFAAIAARIRRNGSLAGIQLSHCPQALGPTARWVNPDSSAEAIRLRHLVNSFSDKDLLSALRLFVSSAELACEAQYDLIQIHAAHGYLLSLLLSPIVNRRTGHFRVGGVWLSDFVDAVLNITKERLVGVRLSLFSGLKKDPHEELSFVEGLSKSLSKAGVHFLDYSAGFYTVNKQLIYPGREKGPAPYLAHALGIAPKVASLVGVAGNCSQLEAVGHLPDNMVLSIGRAFLADARFARFHLTGESSKVVPCKFSNKCHYFSRGRTHIECEVNPELRAKRIQ